jgi:hypothetical protein
MLHAPWLVRNNNSPATGEAFSRQNIPDRCCGAAVHTLNLRPDDLQLLAKIQQSSPGDRIWLPDQEKPVIKESSSIAARISQFFVNSMYYYKFNMLYT